MKTCGYFTKLERLLQPHEDSSETGYLHHQRCESTASRSRACLTERGRGSAISSPASSSATRAASRSRASSATRGAPVNGHPQRLDRFWGDQIRYIY